MITKFLDLGMQLLANEYLTKKNIIKKNVDYAFLGAWNYKEEIFKKEKRYIENGGKFITHVPIPKII